MITTPYKEIDGSHTFIKKIITQHYDNIPKTDQENFDKIRVYNTIEDPLFNGMDVYYCLKKTTKKVDRMYDDLLDDEVLRQQTVIGVSRPINLITEYGIIHACHLYKTEIAIIFQKFMREVIKQLKTKGVATLVESHKQLIKTLESEREKRKIAEHINIQNIIYQDAYINDFQENDDDQTELTIMRNMHLTKYYLYIVDWNYMNTKYWKKDKPTPEPKHIDLDECIDLVSSDSDCENKKSNKLFKRKSKKMVFDNTPHENAIYEQYDLDFIQVSDLINGENEEYYFFVSPKEVAESKKEFYKFMKFIYIDKAKHYNEMIEVLKTGEVPNKTAYTLNNDLPIYKKYELDLVSTPVKNIFKCSYSMINSARNRSFIRTYKNHLK